jgi:2-dehydro-3-deoxygalactonokinase
MHTQLLGIDWGTSNRRAYLIGRDGRCIARHEDDHGLLSVAGRFAESLDQLRRIMDVGPAVPVLMSGMVGSASGWQEVPYMEAGQALSSLPGRVVAVRGVDACAIVPGCVWRGEGVDVMRGEETQLLGALALGAGDGWVVLPGTHSKWVRLEGGIVRHLRTYMTGELFAMLGKGGTLAGMMAAGEELGTAFDAGLDAARSGAPLTHTLFAARAQVVTGAMAASAARSYISGLLIGAEFAAANSAGARHLALVASPALSARYALAASRFGMTAQAYDPDAVYCAALVQFFDKV